MFIKLFLWGNFNGFYRDFKYFRRRRKGIYIPLKVRKTGSKKNLKNHNNHIIKAIYLKLLPPYLECKTILHFL